LDQWDSHIRTDDRVNHMDRQGPLEENYHHLVVESHYHLVEESHHGHWYHGEYFPPRKGHEVVIDHRVESRCGDDRCGVYEQLQEWVVIHEDFEWCHDGHVRKIQRKMGNSDELPHSHCATVLGRKLTGSCSAVFPSLVEVSNVQKEHQQRLHQVEYSMAF
jgi:hypothetical protein